MKGEKDRRLCSQHRTRLLAKTEISHEAHPTNDPISKRILCASPVKVVLPLFRFLPSLRL